MSKKQSSSKFLTGIVVLTLAALACTAPGAQQPDTAATVGAIYATITQQANLPPRTATVLAATTNPSQATPTQLVPATATPPDSRGPLTVIHTCPNAVTIDVKVNDWPDSVTALNIDQVTYDPDKEWTGPADLGGTVKICWTDAALFLLVSVIDDVHFQTQRGGESYKGDEVELMYDADLRGDFYKTSWDADDHQLSLNPGEFGVLVPEAYRYRPSPGTPGGVRLDAKSTSGEGARYRVEAEIAWGELGGKPVNTQNYGLCIAISDSDHPEKAPAEDTLASHCAGLSVSNPATWQSMTFVTP